MKPALLDDRTQTREHGSWKTHVVTFRTYNCVHVGERVGNVASPALPLEPTRLGVGERSPTSVVKSSMPPSVVKSPTSPGACRLRLGRSRVLPHGSSEGLPHEMSGFRNRLGAEVPLPERRGVFGVAGLVDASAGLVNPVRGQFAREGGVG